MPPACKNYGGKSSHTTPLLLNIRGRHTYKSYILWDNFATSMQALWGQSHTTPPNYWMYSTRRVCAYIIQLSLSRKFAIRLTSLAVLKGQWHLFLEQLGSGRSHACRRWLACWSCTLSAQHSNTCSNDKTENIMDITQAIRPILGHFRLPLPPGCRLPPWVPLCIKHHYILNSKAGV